MATATWQGASGKWSVAANWGGVVPNFLDLALLPAPGSYTVTLDGGPLVTVGSVLVPQFYLFVGAFAQPHAADPIVLDIAAGTTLSTFQGLSLGDGTLILRGELQGGLTTPRFYSLGAGVIGPSPIDWTVGTLDAEGGTIWNGITVTANNTLAIIGGALALSPASLLSTNIVVDGGELRLAGTRTFDNTAIQISSTGAMRGETLSLGGTVEVSLNGFISASSTLVNAGTIIGNGGIGAPVLVNNGTIRVGDGGTLAISGGGLGGTGVLALGGNGGLLRVNGTIMPANQIRGLGGNARLDLADVVATAASATVDTTGHAVVPTAGGGVTLALDPRLGFAGVSVGLAPDGGGGTVVTLPGGVADEVVTIRGGAGQTFGVRQGTSIAALFAGLAATEVSAGLTGGTTVPWDVGSGPMPTLAGGQVLEILDHVGGAVTLPSGVGSLFFSDAPGVSTVTGGDMGGAIIVGSGGLDFTAGAGAPGIYAGNGANRLRVDPGMPGVNAWLGNGSNVVEAIGGNNTISTGTGSNLITLGIGFNLLSLSGTDTILAGPGGTYMSASGPAADLVFMGSTVNTFIGSPTGTATIVGGAGVNNVADNAANTIFYAAGRSSFQGAGTVVGGSATLDASLGTFVQGARGSVIFAGTGPANIGNYNGSSTIVGNAAGASTIYALGGSVLDFAVGPTFFDGAGGGLATVVGISGHLDVHLGKGLFLAPPDGGSTIDVQGNATAFATAAGDVLSTRFVGLGFAGAPAVLVGGAGAETLTGAGGYATNTIYAGSGPERIEAGEWLTSVLTGAGPETLVGSANGIALFAFLAGQAPAVTIENFSPARDYLTLIGFGTSEVAGALASAVNVGGSETLTLTGGTTITFHGFTGLTAASFL